MRFSSAGIAMVVASTRATTSGGMLVRTLSSMRPTIGNTAAAARGSSGAFEGFIDCFGSWPKILTFFGRAAAFASEGGSFRWLVVPSPGPTY